jgi:hypothetical protein
MFTVFGFSFLGRLRRRERTPVPLGRQGSAWGEPTATQAREQFGVELVPARRHLHEILECYWDRDWRAEHRQPQGPEEHLWRSAQGVRELEAAIGASR